MLTNASLYKSSRGYRAMMSTYSAQLARWPVPVQEMTLPTRYGETHLLASGPADAPPLVLIHGLAANALVWRPNVAALSQHFRLYALDNIGDAGKSAPTRPPLYGPAYGEWLLDVFDGLKLERANVVGMSLGGWLALKVASHAPERIARLMPLCPAGFVPLRLAFVPLALCVGLLPNEITIDWVARALCSPSRALGREDSELLDLTMRYHRSKRVPLRLLTDDELRRITAPITLLAGEHEAIFNPGAMASRARAVWPRAQVALLPNAGHALNSDQPDLLHKHIMAFFG